MKHRLTPADRKARRSRRATESLNGKAVVNTGLLLPTNSYDVPEFVKRGYYQDKPFKCRDCGKDQIWTASQQKWWYEIAQGDVNMQAQRCRDCRRRERVRRAEARRVHLEGLAVQRSKVQG